MCPHCRRAALSSGTSASRPEQGLQSRWISLCPRVTLARRKQRVKQMAAAAVNDEWAGPWPQSAASRRQSRSPRPRRPGGPRTPSHSPPPESPRRRTPRLHEQVDEGTSTWTSTSGRRKAATAVAADEELNPPVPAGALRWPRTSPARPRAPPRSSSDEEDRVRRILEKHWSSRSECAALRAPPRSSSDEEEHVQRALGIRL